VKRKRQLLIIFPTYSMQLPFVFVHPSKLRPIFLAKGILLPLVAIGTMAWSIHEAGDRAGAVLRAPTTLSGLPAWYAFMTAVTACMGTWSTMACNIGDFSRYSKKETSAWMQMLFVPALWCITSLFGAIASNMTLAIYGEILWQPFDIIDKWEGSHGGRLAAFVCAAGE
jgi:nucleobase:cation symporter-1, NCS1 family